MSSLKRSHLMTAAVLIVIGVIASLPLPFYTRQWHKFLHILGAVLFIGNIVVTAAWMILARFTQQVKVLHFAARSVMMADILFTLPGVVLLFINGLILAPAFGNGNILGAGWVVAGLILLILSGIVWAGFLLRYQGQLIELSATGDEITAAFTDVYKKWAIWGVIATILPIISLILMVFKPALGG